MFYWYIFVVLAMIFWAVATILILSVWGSRRTVTRPKILRPHNKSDIGDERIREAVKKVNRGRAKHG